MFLKKSIFTQQARLSVVAWWYHNAIVGAWRPMVLCTVRQEYPGYSVKSLYRIHLSCLINKASVCICYRQTLPVSLSMRGPPCTVSNKALSYCLSPLTDPIRSGARVMDAACVWSASSVWGNRILETDKCRLMVIGRGQGSDMWGEEYTRHTPTTSLRHGRHNPLQPASD